MYVGHRRLRIARQHGENWMCSHAGGEKDIWNERVAKAFRLDRHKHIYCSDSCGMGEKKETEQKYIT